MSIHLNSSFNIPDGTSLVCRLQSLLETPEKGSKIPEILKEIKSFIKNTNTALLSLENTEKKFTSLTSSASQVKDFTLSISPDNISKEHEVKYKRIAKSIEQLFTSIATEKQLNGGVKSFKDTILLVEKEKKSVVKAKMYFGIYNEIKALKSEFLEMREPLSSKLQELRLYSHPFLECISEFYTKGPFFDPAKAREICCNFLKKLDSLDLPKESGLSKGFTVSDASIKKIFAFYMECKKGLQAKEEQITEHIEQCAKDLHFLRVRVNKLNLLKVVKMICKNSQEKEGPLLKFLDPKGTFQVASTLGQKTPFVEKIQKIKNFLTDQLYLKNSCSWEQFGKLFINWPLFLNTSETPVCNLSPDPLQTDFAFLKEMADPEKRKKEIFKLLDFSKSLPSDSENNLDLFLCQYFLNFLDRQGTERANYFFEKESTETSLYRQLAKELESACRFKTLVIKEKGSGIGEKYRTEQFKTSVQVKLLNSFSESEYLHPLHTLSGHFPETKIQKIFAAFKRGNYDCAKPLALCFKIIITKKYLDLSPDSFYQKNSKEKATFILNYTSHYIQYNFFKAKKASERAYLIAGLLKTAKASIDIGDYNSALAIFLGISHCHIEKKHFPDVRKLLFENKPEKNTMKWLEENFIGSKFAKFLEEQAKEDKMLAPPVISNCLQSFDKLHEGFKMAESEEEKTLAKENLGVFFKHKVFKDFLALQLWSDAWSFQKNISQLSDGLLEELNALKETLGEDPEEELYQLYLRERKA